MCDNSYKAADTNIWILIIINGHSSPFSNPKEELEKLIQKASIMENLFDLHFRDHHGYTLLGNAVRLGQLDVVQFLVGERNFKVKEELTIAVEVDFKDCVDYFIKRQPELVGRKV